MPLSDLTNRFPPNDEKSQVSCSVKKGIFDRYDAAAKKSGLSRSQLVAAVLEESIDEVEAQIAKVKAPATPSASSSE